MQIIYQKLFGDKLPEFLFKLGFKNIELLKHGSTFDVKDCNLKFTLFQIGIMDSCLLIQNNNKSILINNDCELSNKDFRFISSYYNKLDLLMSQFSIAGYDGIKDRDKLNGEAESKLEDLVVYCKNLKAKNFIPYASFIYFCSQDNHALNEYLNTIEDVYNKLNHNNLKCTLLLPGDNYNFKNKEKYDNHSIIIRYREMYENFNKPLLPSTKLDIKTIEDAFFNFIKE